MSNKEVLLKRSQLASEVDEPAAPLDYLQVRNKEALEAWRMRLAYQKAYASAALQHNHAGSTGAPQRHSRRE
jgi:hypothetical protein